MSEQIVIEAAGACLRAECNDSECAQRILAALPIEVPSVSTWGEEIYFGIDVACDLEPDARTEMAVGELAYWPPGQALCLFFGRTPASDAGGAPRAASEVNPIGRLIDDPTALRAVGDGSPIRIRKAGD